MNNTESRTAAFSRNYKLEAMLAEMSELLQPVQRSVENRIDISSIPKVFIIGPPRSGTTLLLQWLVGSGLFSYPSNLLSRFYAAPYVGALVQNLLTNPDYDYKDELSDLHVGGTDYESAVGKTKGALSPNEFWYWWRQFLPVKEIEQISEAMETEIDVAGMQKSMASIQTVWPKPFVAKGKMLQFNLKRLLEIFPDTILLHSKRHCLYNVQSLLITRENVLGSDRQWFSVKPPGYEEFLNKSPEEQVASQVYLTNKAIEEQVVDLPHQNYMVISHEEFCASPKTAFDNLILRLNQFGYTCCGDYKGPDCFKVHNTVRVNSERATRIIESYQSVSAERLSWDF